MTTDCPDCEPSDAEMNEAQEALARWQTTQEFASKVESFAPLVKSSTLFNKANAGFLRDAIPIAAFTKHRAVQSVRLVRQRERLNDGQFRNAGETFDIEVTEVMEPGRRRGDEYRCGADQQGIRHFDPYLGETIANELAKSIKKKADKGYPTKPVLLVYLNISNGGRLGVKSKPQLRGSGQSTQIRSAKSACCGALSGTRAESSTRKNRMPFGACGSYSSYSLIISLLPMR